MGTEELVPGNFLKLHKGTNMKTQKTKGVSHPCQHSRWRNRGLTSLAIFTEGEGCGDHMDQAKEMFGATANEDIETHSPFFSVPM